MPLPRNLFRLLTNFNPFSFYLSKFLSFHFSLTTWNSNFTQNNNNNNNYERNKSFPNQVLSTLGRAGSTLSPTSTNLVNPTSEKDASHPCLVSTLLVLVHEISFDLHYSLLMIFSVFSNGFANRNAVVPNFNHVNQPSLDKILKAEVFVHTDGQLRAAHLILDYIPISKSFRVPKCVIKAKDPRLHRINVATPGFLIIGLVPKGTLTTTPIPEGIPKVALPPQHTIEEATSSHLAITKEEEKEEEMVEVSDSEDEFEVFNQPLSPEASTGDLDHPFTSILDEKGIQHKPRSILQELLESQSWRDAPGKVA